MSSIPPNQASLAPPWTGIVRSLFVFGFAASIILIVLLSSAALPLAIGVALLAYLLYPIKRFLQRRVTGGRSGPAVATVLLIVLGSLIIFALILIPTVALQAINFFEATLPAANRFFTEPLVFNDSPVLDNSGEPFIISERIMQLSDQYLSDAGMSETENALTESALSIGEQVVSVLGGVTLNVVNISFQIFGSVTALLLNTLFLVLLLAFFLSDGEKMIDHIVRATPEGFEPDARRLFWEFGQVWNDYLRGQLILGGSIAAFMWLLAMILGLESPLFLGIFAGLMEFIPNLGAVLSIIPPILLALISGSSTFPEMNVFVLVAILVVVWVIAQQFQGLVIQPRVIGDSLNLHPVLIVFGVIIGGSLGGIVGIILSAPTLATLRIILQYVYGRIANKPPFRNNPEYEQWLEMQTNRVPVE
ncbi:MAG: AI-2E family transporter [Chloroflexota bacterium]